MPSKEIVVRPQTPYELTEKQVNILANTAMVPDDKRGKHDLIWASIFKGRSIGIDDMSAIQEIHIVNGKPGLSAALAGGIARKRGHSIKGEFDSTKAVAHGTRGDNGDQMTVTFTIDDAKNAGLATKDVWKKYPGSMLWARAVTQLCRSLFPDCFIGGVYTPEELGADYALDDDVIEGTAEVIDDEPEPEPEQPSVPSTLAEFKQWRIQAGISDDQARAAATDLLGDRAPNDGDARALYERLTQVQEAMAV